LRPDINTNGAICCNNHRKTKKASVQQKVSHHCNKRTSWVAMKSSASILMGSHEKLCIHAHSWVVMKGSASNCVLTGDDLLMCFEDSYVNSERKSSLAPEM
jgi:hypothetical protein